MANQYTYSYPFTEAQLRMDYEAGMSQTEVAEKYGTTQRVVFNAMRRFGIKSRVAAKRDQRGPKNTSWKGDKASYEAFHYRMDALKGKPKKCEFCETVDPRKTYDWANMTGKYNDPEDYRRLCRTCHWKLDKKVLNIKRMRDRSRVNLL